MDHEALSALVERIHSLDAKRKCIGADAFRCLAENDRQLWMLGKEIFNNEDQAAAWFSEPVISLQNRIPLDLVINGRREDVINCLYKIRDGIFT